SGWYPGWQNKWWDERHILPPHRLIRRLERQGFYNVRLFGFSHRGMIRAQGFDERGFFVRLRVDPYSGRVIRVMPA
ncbi:MAG TPA: hypothetical protein DCL48_03840, partial [Alphaproteobacteria bacterium]|nr:hypothetical protein [Alphaproteobacteria bacterium]